VSGVNIVSTEELRCIHDVTSVGGGNIFTGDLNADAIVLGQLEGGPTRCPLEVPVGATKWTDQGLVAPHIFIRCRQ
jgi:hypothetical protein